MHLSGIYFILNKVTLKLYIGSAVYFARRRSEHFTRLAKNIHHNEHMQRAYNKYGKEAFDFIIVEIVPLDKLIELETYYIAKHRTTEEDFGYNKCPFGISAIGRKHSPETIEKIRISNSGKTVPQERRDKISATLKAKNLKMSPEHKAKLIKINTERDYRKGKECPKNPPRRPYKKATLSIFLNSTPIDWKRKTKCLQ